MAVALAHIDTVPRQDDLDDRIGRIAGVRRLRIEDLAGLVDHFASHQSPDPYAHSPAYAALTARRGLWLYEKDGARLLFGLHPNTEGRLVIFPPATERAAALVPLLAEELPPMPLPLQVIRIPARQSAFLAGRFNSASSRLRFTAGEEEVLDWRFPVHTIDTRMLARPDGGAFRDLRKKLARAARAGLAVEPLDMERHGRGMLRLGRAWAQAGPGEPDDRMAPVLHGMAIWRTGTLDLEGFAIRQQDRIVGFQIWENPLPGCTTANGLIGIGDTRITGLAELQEVERARALTAKGIGRMCIGGSETPGLDRFKRKLRPSRSEPLVTLTATAGPA